MAALPPASLSEQDGQQAGVYAWFVFLVIAALGFTDWVVRQIVVGIFPVLQADWRLTDSEIGALSAVVPLMVGVMMMPVALLVDRWSRVKTIFCMALLWSLAMIACGIAASYEQLLLARAFIGLGEAAYGPAGFALLAWYFPMRMRSTVIGGVLVACSLGNVLGVGMGGTLAEQWGWRDVFIAVGAVSLLVSFAALGIRDYPTPALPPTPAEGGRARQIAVALLGSPTVVLTCLGSASLLFVMSALVTWLPSLLFRDYGMTAAEAAKTGGLGVGLTAVGAVVWAQIADRWGLVRLQGRLFVPAIGAAGSTLLLCCAFLLMQPDTLQLVVVIGVFFFTAAVMGPVNTVVMDVVEPGLRATATALVGVAQNLIGLAAGPLVVGWLSGSVGLASALLVLPLAATCSATFFLLASRHYARERTTPLIQGV